MLEIGQIVEGKVTGLTSFGAFVSLPEGKSGMVHISEVSNAFVKEIKDHLTEGQDVKVKIIGINDDGKISLSIKKALPEEQRESRPMRQNRPQRSRPANVWQGQPERKDPSSMSFEDMMARFKQVSDEKITDLKRAGEAKHGGYSKRGRGGNN